MSTLDLCVVLVFLLAVAFVSLYAARREQGKDGYFLAGRKLNFWLIGFSLIASNISTEHFVGMTGQAAKGGIAVASWEWIAVVALVLVALWLMPIFLRAGISTIPEFLELRFDRRARSILAVLMTALFVVTVLSSVLYSGATFVVTVFDLEALFAQQFGFGPEVAANVAFSAAVWGIALSAGIYTVLGGLKAVVWSDLLQGSSLLLGGALVAVLALLAIGGGEGFIVGWQRFVADHPDGFQLVRGGEQVNLPPSTLISGIWIPMIFYWGLNQFITQRALAAGSLAEAQKGVLFAAAIKLFLPLLVVLPGMMALTLLRREGNVSVAPDEAWSWMVRELLPNGLLGFVIAAIFGAVLSTFNSGLNSAATLVTLDLYAVHVKPGLSDRDAVRVGQISSIVLGVLACLWAPMIRSFDGVFNYIQELWGLVSIPTVAVMVTGLLWRRVPPLAAHVALFLGPALYLLARLPSWIFKGREEAVRAEGGLSAFALRWSEIHYLHHFFGIALFLCGLMVLITSLRPPELPRALPLSLAPINLTPWPHARKAGIALTAVVLLLYVLLW